MDPYRIQPLHGRGRRVWAPWREMGEMQWALEQIRARAAAAVPAREEGAFAVDADLCDTGSAYVARVDIPGVTAEQLLVTIEDGVLTIEGQRRDGRPEEAVLRRERRTGRLTRVLRLPGGVDSAGATATLRSGVLEIVLPKAGATARGKVAVDVVWHRGELRNDAGRLTPRV
jgi:HSP20 family protein